MSPQPKPGEGRHNQRRKELARAKEQRQADKRAAREATARRRRLVIAGIAVLVVAIGAVALALRPRGGSQDEAAATPSSGVSELTAASVAGCDQAPTPVTSPTSFAKAPAQNLTADNYTLTLRTNCGKIVIATLPRKAPKTVNSMLWLAEQSFFDNSLCHRLTTAGIYVLQCGDPTATGNGGPGYTVPDENLPKSGTGVYPAGTVAMANSGKDTNGSQFFIVYRKTTLSPAYTVWGKVTDGLDIVKKVAAAGVVGGGTDGTPNQPIGILDTAVSPRLSR